MKIFSAIAILMLSGIQLFAQTSDSITIINKQKQFTEFTKVLIDSSSFKKASDSLSGVKVQIESDIKRLERNLEKNRDAIISKRRELQKIDNEYVEKQKTLNEFKDKIKQASDDYDSFKVARRKMQEDSVKLAAQTAELQGKSDSLSKKNNAAQAELNKMLSEISKKEDSLEAIAMIRIKDTAIYFKSTDNRRADKSKLVSLLSMYYSGRSSFDSIKRHLLLIHPGAQIDTLKIKKIHLSVKEGRIVEIIVKTDKGIFRNTGVQIDLVHFSERRYSDRLFKDDEDRRNKERTYIYPGDVLSYEPIRSYGDIPYSEFEATLTPDSSGKIFIIRENTSINTYFEVAVFTDINGIAGDANGLAQITGSAKFITSTRNVRGSPLMFFQYIAFNGGLSKFDNDFKGTYINAKDSVNRKDLFQRSQYMVGLKVNLLNFVRSPYPRLLIQSIQLNAGYNFVGSRIADSLIKSNDTLYRTVTHNQFYIEPTISFARQKNFNLSVGLPFFYQNIKQSAGISNAGWEWWVCPSINLMYYSKGDSKNKIFFRYNHFINLQDKTQAFNQLQLGFAANITSVLQGK